MANRAQVSQAFLGVPKTSNNQLVARAQELEQAFAIRAVRKHAIAQPTSTNTANTATPSLASWRRAKVTVASLGVPINPGRRIGVGQATETDAAQVVVRRIGTPVNEAPETDSALAIRAGRRRLLGLPVATQTAQPVAFAKQEPLRRSAAGLIFLWGDVEVILRSVSAASDSSSAFAVRAVRAHTFPGADETDTLGAVTARRTRAVGQALETDAGTTTAHRKTKRTGQALEVDNTAGGILFGFWADGATFDVNQVLYHDLPWDDGTLSTAARLLADSGKAWQLEHFGQPPPWRQVFLPSVFNLSFNRGAFPYCYLGMDVKADGTPLAPRNITANTYGYDTQLANHAQAVAAWGRTVLMVPFTEMNGSWFNYGLGKVTEGSANTAAEIVAAWKHVVDIYRANGATNVVWVWNPNIFTTTPASNGVPNPANLYPGDRYVDWAVLDGFNWGSNPIKQNPNGQFWTFDQLFLESYTGLCAIVGRSKPLGIGSVASTEVGGDKAAWIADMLAQLQTEKYGRIRMLVYFNNPSLEGPVPQQRMDWPIESSAAAQAAWQAGIASPYYRAGGAGTVPTVVPSGFAVTPVRLHAVGLADETDLARPIAATHVIAVGQAVSVESGQTARPLRARATAQPTETDQAQAVTASRVYALGAASEADQALGFQRSRFLTLGIASTGDAALVARPQRQVAVAVASETDVAAATAHTKTQTAQRATETELAQAARPLRARALAQALELDEAQRVFLPRRIPVGQALETDDATRMNAPPTRQLSFAAEGSSAFAVRVVRSVVLAQALETDAALAPARVKSAVVNRPVSAFDLASPATPNRIRATGQAGDGEQARPAVALRTRSTTQALETDSALAPRRVKSRDLGRVLETDAAGAAAAGRAHAVARTDEQDAASVAKPLRTRATAQTVETDQARPLVGVHIIPAGQTDETDAAGATTPLRTLAIGQAPETDTSRTVAPLRAHALSTASELSTAEPVDADRAHAAAAAPDELDEAGALTHARAFPLGQPSGSDVGRPFVPMRSEATGQPETVDEAFPAIAMRTLTLAEALEASEAEAMSHFKTLLVRLASEQDEARPVVRRFPPPYFDGGDDTVWFDGDQEILEPDKELVPSG